MPHLNNVDDPKPFLTSGECEVNLLNPDPSTLNLDRALPALARLCRFGGLCDEPWSVLQHLLLCHAIAVKRHKYDRSLICLQRDAFLSSVLYHDFHEAWLGDVPRPLKALLPRYVELEERFMQAIAKRYIPGGISAMSMTKRQVKRVDNLALAIEVAHVMPHAKGRWGGLPTANDLLDATGEPWGHWARVFADLKSFNATAQIAAFINTASAASGKPFESLRTATAAGPVVPKITWFDLDLGKPLSASAKPVVDRADILDRAKKLTCGDRDKAYGTPTENMAHIAALWSAFMADRLQKPLTGDDVAWMNVLMKAARAQTSQQKRDHYDDAAAYAAIAGECAGAS